ncbi:hypothetical protein MHB84_05105 [Paenibacillus sp. FSL F4-0087]|uniref:hypothetical protein n=1 Tax=unclassified Paenibacillus TaxID=185978 RepID=UPI00096DB726|nr:hypothetical protein BK122_17460 [Paenibacillus pabuli]
MEQEMLLRRNTLYNKYESLKSYFDTSVGNINLDDDIEHEYNYFDYKKKNVDIPQYILCSLFVTWFSFIEVEIRNIVMYSLDNKKTDIEQFRYCGLDHIRKFFVKNDVEVDSSLWVKMNILKDIRNRIVHEGPFFNVFSQRISEECKEYIESNKLYRSESKSIFQANSEFIEEVLIFGNEFLESNIKDLSKLIQDGINYT